MQLLKIDTAEVRSLIADIQQDRANSEPELKRIIALPFLEPKARLHASLALLSFDPSQIDYLGKRLVEASPSELLVLRDLLHSHNSALSPVLWSQLDEAKPGDARTLPVAGALAAYDPDSPRWNDSSTKVARAIVTVDAGSLSDWIDVLVPVQKQLKGALEAIFNDLNRPPAEHAAATKVLVRYTTADPETLARLLVVADRDAFNSLFESARGQADKIAPLLQVTRAKQLNPAAFDATSPRPIKEADGLLGQSFAFWQTMPLDASDTEAEALAPVGVLSHSLPALRRWADGACCRGVAARPKEVAARLAAFARGRGSTA